MTSFGHISIVLLYLLCWHSSTINCHHTVKRIVPVITQLSHPGHTHKILRRAVVPTTASILTGTEKINTAELDEELRALKRKRKRLRQLREEVRELTNHLHNKRVLKEELNGDRVKRRKAKEAHLRWRKQITSRVKAIMKRLKRLESEVKYERNHTKDKKKMNNARTLAPLRIPTTPSPRATSVTIAHDIKMKRLHSSINQSKSGESGATCSGHKDCKPGLCCHHSESHNDGIAANTCYQYSLKEGDPCDDTCQCEARLHCFRSSGKISDSQSGHVRSKRTYKHAICKKVSTEDVMNGTFLNAKDSSFLIKATGRRL